MADGIITIRTNLPDFKAQLKQFERALQTKITARADYAAAVAMKNAVKQEVGTLNKTAMRRKDRTPGTLARALYVYRRRNPQAGTVLYSVSFRKGKKFQNKKGGSQDAFYGRFLELGWQPRGPGRKLKGGERSRALQRQRATAAGQHKVKYPFLVPGFNAARNIAIDAFNDKMQREIDLEARKLK